MKILSNSICLQKTRQIFKNYKARINYTHQHRKAFLQTEKALRGKNTFGGYVHDLGKLFLYIIGVPKKTAHNLHRRFSSHHVRNGKIRHIENAVIDWECARLTKPDKPLTARETFEKFYSDVPGVEEVLKKFGL